jgi:hypothetical protein
VYNNAFSMVAACSINPRCQHGDAAQQKGSGIGDIFSDIGRFSMYSLKDANMITNIG